MRDEGLFMEKTSCLSATFPTYHPRPMSCKREVPRRDSCSRPSRQRQREPTSRPDCSPRCGPQARRIPSPASPLAHLDHLNPLAVVDSIRRARQPLSSLRADPRANGEGRVTRVRTGPPLRRQALSRRATCRIPPTANPHAVTLPRMRSGTKRTRMLASLGKRPIA